MTRIIGLKVDNRKENAPEVQKVLTEYGCAIRTRLGLHITDEDKCSTAGLILLEVTDEEESEKIINRLREIGDIEIQQMKF